MFLNVYKQTFHISHVHISQKVKGVLIWNLQHIIFIWRRRYWQIFRSALVYLSEQESSLLCKHDIPYATREFNFVPHFEINNSFSWKFCFSISKNSDLVLNIAVLNIRIRAIYFWNRMFIFGILKCSVQRCFLISYHGRR